MPKRIVISIFLVFLAILLAWSCGGRTSSGAAPDTGVPAPSNIAHVAIVALENQSYEDVITPGAMPYFQQLASQYGLATKFNANLHPSIPNYFLVTTGNIVSTESEFSGTYTGDNIVRRVRAAGKTWKTYHQSLPAAGQIEGDYPYVKRHNPFAYMTDVINTAERTNIVPLGQLHADIAANRLPNYMFIVPDQRNNAHDCPTGDPNACPNSAKMRAADDWLKNNIPALLANSSFAQNGLLVLWWDEGIGSDTRGGGGQIAVVLAGPRVKNGFSSTTPYRQESILKLTTQALGLEPMPSVAGATSMGEFFK